MEENNKNQKVIDLGVLVRRLYADKKLFVKPLGIVFVLSCVYIFSLPRYYRSEVKLAPELEGSLADGALGNIASSFGMDLGAMTTSDAISPDLYPELLGTNDFVTLLFPITVEDAKGELKTTYYNYLDKHQKHAWWAPIRSFLLGWMSNSGDPNEPLAAGGKVKGDDSIDPLNLTRRQNKIASSVKNKITCSVDRKTNLVTIGVTDQDKRICAIVADSIRLLLQEFIIDYRTKKSRVDVDYFRALTTEARAEYEEASRRYAKFVDANRNMILQSALTHRDDLENDMQIKLNNYTAYNTQLQAAIAKLQQRTPSFTLLQGAAVPDRPAGPKRMIFVAIMMILATIGTSLYILRDLIFNE